MSTSPSWGSAYCFEPIVALAIYPSHSCRGQYRLHEVFPLTHWRAFLCQRQIESRSDRSVELIENSLRKAGLLNLV
jgi:hypothetical protein